MLPNVRYSAVVLHPRQPLYRHGLDQVHCHPLLPVKNEVRVKWSWDHLPTAL